MDHFDPDRRYNLSDFIDLGIWEDAPTRGNSEMYVTAPGLPPHFDTGSRHGNLVSAAARLRNVGLDRDEIAGALLVMNEKRTEEPKPADEVEKIAAWAATKESTAEREAFRNTDFGNAQRLVAQHGRDLCYSYPLRKWHNWTGLAWRLDESGAVERRAKDTVRGIYTEAAEADDPDQRATLAKWAARSEDRRRIEAMIALAQSEPGIPIPPAALDPDPWLFNSRTARSISAPARFDRMIALI